MAKKTSKSKYLPTHPETVKILIVECGLVNNRGEIAWEKIGGVLGVSVTTLRKWRIRSKDPAETKRDYKPEFAAAVKDAIEAVDAGQIKRGVIALSKPHLTYDVTKELRKVGPTAPPKDWPKDDLIEWADKYLDLEIDPGMSKPQVIQAIRRECFELTEEKMVKTKERKQKQVDMAAVKLVLANIGPESERWLDKSQVKNPEEILTSEDCENLRAILRENQK